MIDAPTSTIGVVGFTVVSAMACVILAFSVIFLLRFLTAPGRLYLELERKLKELSVHPISDLSISLREGMGIVADTRAPLPNTKAFMIRVKNIGNKSLRGCQAAVIDREALWYVSSPFDLRIDGHEDIPIIHIPFDVPETPEVRPISKGDAFPSYSCILNAGLYEVKVFSDDCHSCSVAVRLEWDNQSWTVAQCG